MVTTFVGSSPGGGAEDDSRLDQVQWLWQQLFVGEDSGERRGRSFGVCTGTSNVPSR